jgi:TfoX/Sxy family transcriptional regulator of competence genes
MARKSDRFAEELVARLEPIGAVRYRLMFGAAGLYVDEVMTGSATTACST